MTKTIDTGCQMDPNETLSLIRARSTDILEGAEDISKEEAADELAELALALDAWLNKGGFLPAEWEAGR